MDYINKYPKLKSFLAGSFGGLCGILISHPPDTIKNRIQTDGFFKYRNICDLYKGLGPPLFGVVIEKTIVFGSYNTAEKLLSGKFSNDSVKNGLAGVFAGLACTSIVTPIERIKINLQHSNRQFNNSIDFFRNSVCKYGLRKTLYRGWTATLTREVPGYGIYFSTFDYIKKNIFNNNPNPFQTFLTGGFCGAFSWFFIYPSDVIKSRMQTDNNKFQNNGVWYCLKNSVKNEGFKIFYKGFHLSLLRAIPLHAGVFTGYELFMKL